jgi:tetratricopeptide (TPR) repeat protein
MDQRACDLIYSPNFLVLARDFIIKNGGEYDYNDKILFLDSCAKGLACKEIKTDESARDLAFEILEKTKEDHQQLDPADFSKKYDLIFKNAYPTIILKKFGYFLWPRLFSYKYLLKHLVTLLVVLGSISLIYLFMEEKGKIIFHPTNTKSLQKSLPNLDGETISSIIVAEIAEIQTSQQIVSSESRKLGLRTGELIGNYPMDIQLQKDFSSGFSQAVKQIENIEFSGTKIPSGLIVILLKPLNRFLDRKMISSVMYPKEGEIFFHAFTDEGQNIMANSREAKDVITSVRISRNHRESPQSASSLNAPNDKNLHMTEKAISSLAIFSCRIFLTPDFGIKPGLNWRHLYYITQGWKAYRAQNLELAQACFDAAAEIAPENYLTFYSQGLYYFLTGEHEKADKAILKSLDLNPKKSEEYLAIGIIFSRLANQLKEDKLKIQALKNSFRSINLALNRNPSFTEAYLARGFLNLVIKKFDKSIEDLNRVIEADPNNEDALVLQGTSYYSKEEYDNSVQYFKRALEINPQNIAALNNISVSYIYLRVLDQSFKHLSRGLKLRPKDTSLLNNRGLTYSVKGVPSKAVKAYRRALSYTSDSEIQSNLAFSLFELDQTENAINQWKGALEKKPKNLDAKAGLAVGYYYVGDSKSARDHFNDVINIEKNFCKMKVLENKYLWPRKARSVVKELISLECPNIIKKNEAGN